MLDKKKQNRKLVTLSHQVIESDGLSMEQLERKIIAQLIKYSHEEISIRLFSSRTLFLLKLHPLLKDKIAAIWKYDINLTTISLVATSNLRFDVQNELEHVINEFKNSPVLTIHYSRLKSRYDTLMTRMDISLDKIQGNLFCASFWIESSASEFKSIVPFLKDVFGIYNLSITKIHSKYQDKLLTTILEKAGDSVEITDEEAVIQYVNPAFEKITLYTAAEALNKTVASLLRSSIQDTRLFDEIKQQLDRGNTWRGQIQSRKKDGSYWIAQTVIVPVMDEELGKITQHIAIKQDITEQVKQIDQLKISEERYRNLMNAASDAIYVHNLQGWILEANTAACHSLGYSRTEIVKLQVWDIEIGPTPETLTQVWEDLQKRPINLEGRHKRKDGSTFPVDVRLSIFNATGEKLVLAIVRDISIQKRYEEMLKHQATYDNLTNLPNRFYGYNKLEHAISKAHASKKKLAVLFIDLDEFKQINDSLGHGAGDLLLKAVSERYLSVIRRTDTIARLGGDEFMIILENLNDFNDVEFIAKKCHEICLAPFKIESHELLIFASIGIAIYPDHGQDAKTLMRNADTAMYQSKVRGMNNWTVFVNTMAEVASTRKLIKAELQQVLARNELYICYQPIIDIKINKVIAAEALLRWQSAVLGPIMPDQIIPIAEETGLIIPLGYWILKKVCYQAKEWQTHYGKNIKVAVNISTIQLKQKDFVTKVKQILKETKLDPEYLIFEITESAFIDDSQFILSQLNQLNAMNIHCSLDDFGMGYSSLSYIRSYPFKSLKIDRVFIQGITSNSDDLSLVNSIITMSRNLKLAVIAEGVETAEQLALMQSMNCDMVQGWYFAQALTNDKFLLYLDNN